MKDDPILKEYPSLNISRAHDMLFWHELLRGDCDRMVYWTEKGLIINTEQEWPNETILSG